MKNKVQTNNLAYFTIVLVTVCLIFIMANMSIFNAYAESSEKNITYLTQEKYEITNLKNPNNVDITSYPTNHYGKNATLEWGNHKKINVVCDDDIVKLIPKELFMKVGVVQHIGKGYGFFIDTKKPFADNDMLLSTVMLIDVQLSDDMTSVESPSHLKIKLAPIFQADFAYIKKGNNKIYSLGEQTKDFYQDLYKKDLEVTYPANGNDFVIPIPTYDFDGTAGWPILKFKQHNKYFLTNVSNQVSLYNQNHYNPYDSQYVPKDDMGCYFTQTDFAYDGFFMQQGKENMEELGQISFNVASVAFDAYDMLGGLKSVFKAVPMVGNAVSTIDIIKGINSFGESLKMQTISDKKKLTYKPLYNSKELQIQNYNALTKDTAIAITSADNKQLLFATGDFVEFDYQIHCQDIKVDTLYASLINVGIMPIEYVAGKTNPQFGSISYYSSSFINELKTNEQGYKEIPTIKPINLNNTADINMLPYQESYRLLTPIHSGKYKINFDNTKYLRCVLYEAIKNDEEYLDYNDMSNIIYQSNGSNNLQSEIYLDKNKQYFVKLDLQNNTLEDGIKGRYGMVKMDIEFLPQVVMLGDNNYNLKYEDNYLTLKSDFNANYRFTLSDKNVALHLLDENFNAIQSSSNGELLATLQKNKNYYFRIDKNATSIDNVGLYIHDEMNVTFENADKFLTDKQMIYSSVKNSKLPIINEEGYKFEGWWTSLNTYGELVTNENITDFAQPNLTLYAKITPIEYTIHYETNGGTQIEDGKYIIEHIVYLNPNVSKEGYIFAGWFDNPQLEGNKIERLEKGNIGDKTFYAKWVKEKFIITLNLRKDITGEEAEIEKLEYEVYYNQHFKLPVPYVKDYDFEGWYKEDFNFITDKHGNSNQKYTFEQDIELIAHWTINTFYIKLETDNTWIAKDANGNVYLSNTRVGLPREEHLCPGHYIANQLKKNDDYAKKIAVTLHKQGLYFLTMSLENKEPIKYEDYREEDCCWQTMNYLEKATNKDICVYPFYAKEEYSVTFVFGEDSDEIHQLNYESNLEQIKKPTKKGYKFICWQVASFDNYETDYPLIAMHYPVGTKMESILPDLTLGYENQTSVPIKLEPYFEPLNYNVYFEGINVDFSSKQVTYGQVYNTSSGNAFPVPTRTGYTFAGWYANKDFSSNKITDSNGNTINNGWNIPNDCTLYAKWEPNEYKITFDFCGGVDGTPHTIVKYDEYLPETNITAPTRKGYKFAGYYTSQEGGGTQYYTNNMTNTRKWDLATNATLYAKWTEIVYTINYNNNDGNGYMKSTTHNYTKEYTLPNNRFSRDGYIFIGWSTTNDNKKLYDDMATIKGLTENDSITLYACWKIKTFNLAFFAMDVTASTSDSTKWIPIKDKAFKEIKLQYDKSCTVAAEPVEHYTFLKWDTSIPLTTKINGNSITITFDKDPITIDGYTVMALYTKDGCVAEGTMITLADGSQKAVEDLTGNESLLVWDMYKGKFSTAPILFIDKDTKTNYEVINLTFSDGTFIKVISEHAFWDFNLNKYVFLRKDASKYIGHWFNKQSSDASGNLIWTKVKLTNVEIKDEITTAYSPVTYSHLCYYVNGMLSMPGATEGLINIFEVDDETMKINEELMQADIEKYGLYTYEEFSKLMPISEEMFNTFNGQYLKVSIGKGLITIEELKDLFNRYSSFLTK